MMNHMEKNNGKMCGEDCRGCGSCKGGSCGSMGSCGGCGCGHGFAKVAMKIAILAIVFLAGMQLGEKKAWRGVEKYGMLPQAGMMNVGR